MLRVSSGSSMVWTLVSRIVLGQPATAIDSMGRDGGGGDCLLSSSSPPGSPSEEEEPDKPKKTVAELPHNVAEQQQERSPNKGRESCARSRDRSRAKSPHNNRIQCPRCSKWVCNDEYSLWQHETQGSCKRRQESRQQWAEWTASRKHARGASVGPPLPRRRGSSSRGGHSRDRRGGGDGGCKLLSKSRSRSRNRRVRHTSHVRGPSQASKLRQVKKEAPPSPKKEAEAAESSLLLGTSSGSRSNAPGPGKHGLPMLFRGLASLLEEANG